MHIRWLGHACFEIKSHSLTVVTDPYDPYTGFHLPAELRAEVVTVSHQHKDHNNSTAILGEPQIISSTGAITISGVEFFGLKTFHDTEGGTQRGENTVFKFTLEDLRLLHLGDLGHQLTNDQLEALGEIDILMIPVGGTYTIDAVTAVTVVQQLKPKIILPMHYKIPELVFPLDPVSNFLQVANWSSITRDVLEIDKLSLPAQPEIILLKPYIIKSV